MVCGRTRNEESEKKTNLTSPKEELNDDWLVLWVATDIKLEVQGLVLMEGDEDDK